MIFRIFLPLLYATLFCGYILTVGANETPEVFSIKNSSYKLTVDIRLEPEFYKDFELNKNKIAAQEVTIKNEAKRWFNFKPIDHDTLRSSKGYFYNVWSPDNNYLVLPLGRFQGFAIFSVTYIQNSMDRLVTKQYYGADLIPERTLHIVSEFGPALWHEFVGWEGEHTLVINVGLGKDFKKFKYNINKNTLIGYKHWKGRITQSRLIAVEK